MDGLNLIRKIRPGLSVVEDGVGKRYLLREIPSERTKVYEKAQVLSLPIPCIRYVGYNASRTQQVVIEEMILSHYQGNGIHEPPKWVTLWQLGSQLSGNIAALSLLLFGVLEAVTRMHKEGFIHGNLNPHTILINSDGGVCLQGLDCLQLTSNGAAPCVAYSPNYLCAEQIDGVVCFATDMRLLGLTFAEAYLGYHPMKLEETGKIEPETIAYNRLVFRDNSALLQLLSRMTAVDPQSRMTLDEASKTLKNVFLNQ